MILSGTCMSRMQDYPSCRAAAHARVLYSWGGRKLGSLSNVVFSNGLYDPWHGGGVLRNLSSSVVAVVIPEGAHHLDLMFSHPLDPPSVKQARDTERFMIRQWIDQANLQPGMQADRVEIAR